LAIGPADGARPATYLADDPPIDLIARESPRAAQHCLKCAPAGHRLQCQRTDRRAYQRSARHGRQDDTPTIDDIILHIDARAPGRGHQRPVDPERQPRRVRTAAIIITDDVDRRPAIALPYFAELHLRVVQDVVDDLDARAGLEVDIRIAIAIMRAQILDEAQALRRPWVARQ